MVVDSRTGQVVYSGSPHTYDPAKKGLKEGATFVVGAIAGYFGVNALAGMGGSAASGGSALNAPTAIGGAEFIPASMLAPPASSMAAIEAVAFAPLNIGTASGAAGAVGSVASAASTAKSVAGGIFDSVLKGAKAVNVIFESSKLARALLNMVGAGVVQHTAERDREDFRAWVSAEREKDSSRSSARPMQGVGRCPSRA